MTFGLLFMYTMLGPVAARRAEYGSQAAAQPFVLVHVAAGGQSAPPETLESGPEHCGFDNAEGQVATLSYVCRSLMTFASPACRARSV